MELSCPGCSEVIDVPDKAVSFWSEDCPTCRTKLHVVTTEIENDPDLIDFVLREVDVRTHYDACCSSPRAASF